MILSAIAAKLKQRARADFKDRHYEAALIVQAVCWYLRYLLSYRDIEELFLERGVEVSARLRATDREAATPVPQAALRINPDRLNVH